MRVPSGGGAPNGSGSWPSKPARTNAIRLDGGRWNDDAKRCHSLPTQTVTGALSALFSAISAYSAE